MAPTRRNDATSASPKAHSAVNAPSPKRRRLSPPDGGDSPLDTNMATVDTDTDKQEQGSQDEQPQAAPDSHINASQAIAYWSSTPATVSGVLGGYPALSRTDLQGSANFLTKLRRLPSVKENLVSAAGGGKLRRVADCGAGIGRISLGLLGKVAESVDVVEPVTQFCDVVRNGEDFDGFRGRVWEVGLEAWNPFPADADAGDGTAASKYDVIWNQWCLGQLTDKQLVDYLARSTAWLEPGGFIVVKENLSNHPYGLDIYDETDSSVTRTKEKFESIFDQAGLKILKTELQRGFPEELYPVRIWGLHAS